MQYVCSWYVFNYFPDGMEISIVRDFIIKWLKYSVKMKSKLEDWYKHQFIDPTSYTVTPCPNIDWVCENANCITYISCTW